MKRHRAFTLVELMMAVAVFSIVVGSLSGVVIASMRLVRRSYAESQLSVAQRLERERMLFHQRWSMVSDPGSGLLSFSDEDLASFRTTNRVDRTKVDTRNILTVRLTSTLDGFSRSERIVVPVFGSEQIFNASKVFHD